MSNERAVEIADALVGTCQSTLAAMTEDEEDDVVLMSILDEIIFCCDQCGWWCPVDEVHDGMLCDDCFDGDDDE